MFEQLDALNFQRKMETGRTAPILVLCQAKTDDDDYIDVVVKLSGGCDLREKALIREAFAAFYATDLNLPIPCPYVVHLSDEFIETITDSTVKTMALKSCRVCFGSQYIPGLAVGSSGAVQASPALFDYALDIFVFDMMIGNIDRRIPKPNCIHNAKEIFIIDHEAAFSHFETLFNPKPWDVGVIEGLLRADKHVFLDALRGQGCDLASIRQRVDAINKDRFSQYAEAIPAQWGNHEHIRELVDYLDDVKTNIDSIMVEITRVLT